MSKFSIHSLLFIKILLLTCPHICAGNLIGVNFYSSGIYKTESLTFLNDSMCVYEQTWEPNCFEGIHQYIDTFIYNHCGYAELYQENVEKIFIRLASSSDFHTPLKTPVDKRFYQMLDVQIPKTVLLTDIYTGLTVVGMHRRCRYNMWDIPSYPGKKSTLAEAYANLYNITTDTLWIYNNSVIRFNSTNTLLYSLEVLENAKENDMEFPLTQGLLNQERTSYEYQRYCYVTGKKEVPVLDINDLSGHVFHYSYLNNEETLRFVNDSSGVYRQKDNEIQYSYKIDNNLIVIRYYDSILSRQYIIDTLAYNDGFIFYAKINFTKPDTSNRFIWIKAFQEREHDLSSPDDSQKRKISCGKNKRKYCADVYKNFKSICFDTYIPINLLFVDVNDSK